MKLYQLKNAESALAKLYHYDLLDPGTTFHIMATRNDVGNALESHTHAYKTPFRRQSRRHK